VSRAATLRDFNARSSGRERSDAIRDLSRRVGAARLRAVDARALVHIFERMDAALGSPTELLIRGGSALLALGFEGRTTVDIDVLPASRFADAELRRACAAAGLLYNPPDKEFPPGDYLEVVPEETLVLPIPSGAPPYNTVFRGRLLTVRTPPASDLVVGKLKRLDAEDLADVQFLVSRFGLDEAAIREAFGRLPSRFQNDPVLVDNLRYVVEDLWGSK
jgi:uncharacterized nucleotidyltransferase DUF6036